MQKNEIELKDLHVRGKTKILKRKHKGKIRDFGFGSDFLNMTPNTKNKKKNREIELYDT